MRLKNGMGQAAMLIAGAMALAPAARAEQLTLRVADSFPVGHYVSENMTKPWMERVKELTGGQVEFEYYPAEQLGKAKDLLALTQGGVVDIGYVGVSYNADKLPLAGVGELPEAFATSCAGTLAYWSIAKAGGALDQAELAPQGVRMLMEIVLPPYQIFTSSREIAGLQSFEGLKLRATGASKEIAVKRLDAVPIAISAPETREALSRGTVDGVLFPITSIEPYGLAPELKYGTQGQNFGSFITSYVISQDKWDALPAEVQSAMAEAADEVIPSACKVADDLNEQDKQKMVDQGVTFVELSEGDSARLQEKMSTIGTEWAEEMDARGKAGTEVLKAFREALAAQRD